MAVQIEAASSRHDEGVKGLFAGLKVPVRAKYWARDYSEENPDGAGLPFVAVDEVQGIIGFASVRGTEFVLRGAPIKTGLVTHFLIAEHMAATTVPEMLLDEIGGLGELTLVCGASLSFSKVLSKRSFQCAGNFARALFKPGGDETEEIEGGLELDPLGEFPPMTDQREWPGDSGLLSCRRSADSLRWRFRGPVSDHEIFGKVEGGELRAYAVVRRVKGRGDDELHIVDFRHPAQLTDGFAAWCRRLAQRRDLPVYVSVFGDLWRSALARAGADLLRPRWPVLWQYSARRGDLPDTDLLDRQAWFLTASDGELDGWCAP